MKYPLLTLLCSLSRAVFQCPRCYETVLDLDVINELLCASAHGKYCVKFDEHFYFPLQRAMTVTWQNPVKLICMRLIHVHVNQVDRRTFSLSTHIYILQLPRN